MKSLKDQFVDWVGQQDPEAEYNYCDPRRCAVAQFGQQAGIDHLVNLSAEELVSRFGEQFRTALRPPVGARTFGALASRLSDHAGGE